MRADIVAAVMLVSAGIGDETDYDQDGCDGDQPADAVTHFLLPS
jgi:hypothetical protein